VERRDFVQFAGLTAGALALGRRVPQFSGALTPIPAGDQKDLADAALNARDTKIQNTTNTESYGAGVRVIAAGTWGFAATADVTIDGLAQAARDAVAIARANARVQTEPVQLAPQQGYGVVSWKTPIEKNALEVPLGEKADLLAAIGAAALKAGANYIDSGLFMVNEQKYFASTDGSYIDQDIHRIWPYFSVTVIDPKTGKFESRDALSAPMGMGWEYLSGRPAGKVSGPGPRKYGNYYDMLEDATLAAPQTKEKLAGKSVLAGKYDLVLDPSNLWLTIHESVGHPTELDRVLGYEANYAGTSFATLDKWQSKSFKYGSPHVTIVADKTQPYAVGTVGYDDEGVKTKNWTLIRDGILVDYQKIRDQAHILGQTASDGCCYADSWNDVQFQRMPNVSLQPGRAPMTPAQMIAGVDKGIYIVGESSYSIDQQRYNFQFSGKLFYEIRGGKLAGMLKDVAYQSNTQEFWNSCAGVCDRRDYRLGGTFFDGKGEPGQISAVAHGAVTARFNGVNVLNTARKL